MCSLDVGHEEEMGQEGCSGCWQWEEGGCPSLSCGRLRGGRLGAADQLSVEYINLGMSGTEVEQEVGFMSLEVRGQVFRSRQSHETGWDP